VAMQIDIKLTANRNIAHDSIYANTKLNIVYCLTLHNFTITKR